jgi:SAM-dependent methyltransferase
LRQLGHSPVGLDGCAAFVAMAKQHSGCPVLHQSFFDLSLEPASFDAVYANASLFHVPRAELPQVLGELARCLAPEGVCFARTRERFGQEHEGWQGERYGTI